VLDGALAGPLLGVVRPTLQVVEHAARRSLRITDSAGELNTSSPLPHEKRGMKKLGGPRGEILQGELICSPPTKIDAVGSVASHRPVEGGNGCRGASRLAVRNEIDDVSKAGSCTTVRLN